MEKRCKRAFAYVLAALIIFGGVYFSPVKVNAEPKSVTLKISCKEGMTVPGNYGIDYEVFNSSNERQSGEFIQGNSDGTVKSQNVSVPEGSKIRITVTNAGNDIFYNGACHNEWASVQEVAYASLATEYAFQLQPQNITPGGDGGGQNNGGLPRETINLTINWSGDFGEIKVGGDSLSDVQGHTSGSQHLTSAQCDGSNIQIILQANPTENYSSIKFDGVEQTLNPDSQDRYIYSIPKTTTTLSIVATKGVSTQHTVVWIYQSDPNIGDDALVEHGTVELVSGAVSGSNGYYRVDDGAEVTVKLIPDYGYQVVGAKINNVVDLTPCSGTNEFKFVMPSTHVHFKGIFTKTDDIVANTSSTISNASFAGDKVATTGGTAKMTIAAATPASTASIPEEIDDTKDVLAVDISMQQLFYKNSAEAVWSTTKTELSSAAEVSLVVDQQATEYSVLRTHSNGVVTVTEKIPSSYNSATKTLTFTSNKYSTYTLVPLKNAYPTGGGSSSGGSSSSESSENTSTPVQEVSAPVQVEPAFESNSFGGTEINTWEDLENAILTVSDSIVKTVESTAVAKEDKPLIEITLGRNNSIVPTNLFKIVTKTEEPGIHFFVGGGTAITFKNDDKLSNQEAVNLSCTTSETATGKEIKFTETGSLAATVVLHSRAPIGTRLVTIYQILANGEQKKIFETTPTEKGLFCFEIKELGTYELVY